VKALADDGQQGIGLNRAKTTLEHTAATMVSSSSSDWHGVGSSSLQAVIAILATPDGRNP
jgi:hypothetical protein